MPVIALGDVSVTERKSRLLLTLENVEAARATFRSSKSARCLEHAESGNIADGATLS